MAATRDTQETGTKGGLRSGAVSGFATGLFSIPEGMAYAQLAGVDPVFGLYSGMVATLVASLTTGTILMISTLTSAIALTVGSILEDSGLGGDALPGALFTITLVTGAVMLLMGLLKMGGLVDFVSNAVMTGFVMGASLLIVIGELGDFSGYEPEGANKLAEVWDWFANIGSWDGATTTVALATVAVMLVLKGFRPTEKAAAVAALIVMTVVVAIWSPDSVALVRDIAEIPNSLPTPVLPDLSVIPDVALGSVAVALVALVQGAGISTAYPNPGGRSASQNRDFIGEGLGNAAGAFFQSMPTGGSLSRTGISVSAGARSRWGGIFAAVWLGLLVLLFGNLAELVPLSVIAGLLFVIAGELILARVPSFVLVLRTSPMSVAAMLATFVTALFVPLQWTIFIGAAISLFAFLEERHKVSSSVGLTRTEDGKWREVDVATHLSETDIVVIDYRGSGFFAEIPPLRRRIPGTGDAADAVLILRIHQVERINSTFETLIRNLADELRASGNHLILEGVRPEVMATLEITGTIDVIGPANVIPAGEVLTGGLDDAWERAVGLAGRKG
jgi:sulfate permease, SulP family